MKLNKFLPAVIAVSLMLAGCSTPSAQSEQLEVVVSTSVLGEPISQIVECLGGETEILIPISASAHDYAPSASQISSMITADLVVLNGLELEGGLLDAAANAETDGANILEVASAVNPLPIAEDAEEHADEHADEDHGDFDPHFWLDMERVALAMEIVGAELADVTGDPAATDCAAKVAADIRTAEVEVENLLAEVPVANRTLVTDHHAFEYFAAAYGFEVVGAIIPAVSDLAAASSADLSALAETIAANNVKAIFSQVGGDVKLAEAVAAEVGYEVGIFALYSGSLGEPGSGADTYVGMMKANASTIVQALK